MDDVAPVIDEEEALRADFIGSDDITAALGRAEQGQTEGGKEQSEKDGVVAFDAMQACFELREGGCVNERYSITQPRAPKSVQGSLTASWPNPPRATLIG